MWCRRLVLDMSCATGSIESLVERIRDHCCQGFNRGIEDAWAAAKG